MINFALSRSSERQRVQPIYNEAVPAHLVGATRWARHALHRRRCAPVALPGMPPPAISVRTTVQFRPTGGMRWRYTASRQRVSRPACAEQRGEERTAHFHDGEQARHKGSRVIGRAFKTTQKALQRSFGFSGTQNHLLLVRMLFLKLDANTKDLWRSRLEVPAPAHCDVMNSDGVRSGLVNVHERVTRLV